MKQGFYNCGAKKLLINYLDNLLYPANHADECMSKKI
jgi:hypothetical protein